MRPEDGFDPSLLTDPTEAALLAILGDFPRVVAHAAKLREPHRVARYLEDLAGRFHKWYDTCRVRPVNRDEEVTDLHRTVCGSTTPPVRCWRTALTCLGSRRPSACSGRQPDTLSQT